MDLKPQQRVKLKGALPPNTVVNGVADMGPDLVADPAARRVLIVIADVVTTTTTHETDPDSGEKLDVTVPTLRVRAVEEVSPDDKHQAERMLGRAREHRQARDRNAALALFETDQARYGAAGLLKHGSGVFTGRADPDGDDE